MTNQLQTAIERLKAGWMSLQVELQGSYSIERFHRFNDYSCRVRGSRVALVLLLTPLPCIALSVLKEVPPLKPIEAGVLGNWVFFIRAWIVSAIVGGSIPVMINQDIPRLAMTASQVAFVAMFAAAVAMVTIGIICAFTFFPLPFGVLIVAFPLMCIETICHMRFVAHQLQTDNTLWVDIKRVLASTHCLLSLPFIYPLYIYGFVSLSGTGQVFFVVVLPIMKLIAKNWMNSTLSGRDDIKPEMIVFVVEVFNSLYISNALQSTSSWASTATVMASDLAGFWLSMVDIVQAFSEVQKLMKKIPRHHPLANVNFVQVLLRILAENDTHNNLQNTKGTNNSSFSRLKSNTSARYEKSDDQQNGCANEYIYAKTVESRVQAWGSRSQSSIVIPACEPLHLTESAQKDNPALALTTMPIADLFTCKERELFVRKSMHILFITEYVIMFEYAEVTMPFVYCLFRAALFHLPNRIYFSTMTGLTTSQLVSSTLTVLAYSSLEFLSFVIAVVVMKRTLGVSPLRQLSFVLDTQAGRIQTKLIVILLYVTQMPLAHLGADFSFKFAWIPRH